MTFQIYDTSTNTWVDMIQYWAYGHFESTDNDIDGSNAGRAQSGLMIRDYLGTKMKWNFVSVPVTVAQGHSLLALVRPETFRVKTDIVDGTTRTYNCYSNNRVLTHLVSRSNGTELCKIAFPIIEM